MTNKTKYLIFRYLIPLGLFIIVGLMIDYFKPDMEIIVKITVAVIITYLFSPKIRVVRFMSFRNYQIRWLMLGKVILLPIDASFKKKEKD